MPAPGARPDPSDVSPISGSWSANVSRALREVLEAFASDTVAADILMHALVDGGFAAPPEDADDLEDLVRGALHAEVAATLGEEVAEAVVDGMRPVIAMMRRAETPTPVSPSRSRSEDRETAVPPPPRAHAARTQPQEGLPIPDTRPAPLDPMACVEVPFTASRAPRAGRAASTEQPGVDAVTSTGGHRRPPSLTGAVDLALLTIDDALVERMHAQAGGHTILVADTFGSLRKARVVVVDTRHAFDALGATWGVAIAPQVVILWPADTADRVRFEALQPHVPRVVCAGEEVTPDDLALLVELQLRSR